MSTPVQASPPASDRDPPTLHYRATAEPVASPEPIRPPRPSRSRLGQNAETVSDRIVQGLTWGILGVVLFVWAIVGAIFWLPLLVRTMFRFSISLIQATMDGERPEAAAQMLRGAVTFYRRGFVMAIDAVAGQDAPPPEGKVRRQPIDGGRMMREVLWALVIWYVLLWAVGLAWSPAELWAWFVGLPWGEAFDSVTGAITGALDKLIGGGGGAPATTAPTATPPVAGPTG